MNYETVKITGLLPTTPARVYESWLDAREHTSFTGGRKTEITGRVGAPFTAYDGKLSGKITKLRTHQVLGFSLRASSYPDDVPDSKVEVRLVERPDGSTEITIEQTGVPFPLVREFESIWLDGYFTPMRSYFLLLAQRQEAPAGEPPASPRTKARGAQKAAVVKKAAAKPKAKAAEAGATRPKGAAAKSKATVAPAKKPTASAAPAKKPKATPAPAKKPKATAAPAKKPKASAVPKAKTATKASTKSKPAAKTAAKRKAAPRTKSAPKSTARAKASKAATTRARPAAKKKASTKKTAAAKTTTSAKKTPRTKKAGRSRSR